MGIRDDDPVDNDLFVGTYEGETSYADSNNPDIGVEWGVGKVTVTKLGGDNYSFSFDRDIPDLDNITMTKGDNNTIFFEDGTLGSITISESTLRIAYLRDGQDWTADGTR
ncbi:MAG: hypothetical protein ACTHZ1_04910 [Sphingobacterium sp.]